MKNSLTALFLLTSLITFSQLNSKNDFEKENFFRVGFNAGININRIQGKSFEEEFSFDYGARGFLQFNFSRKFGLQPESGSCSLHRRSQMIFPIYTTTLLWEETR